MLKAKFFVVLFVLLALGLHAASAQQNTPAPADLFTLASDDPVVTHGITPDWDGQYTDPGAVLVHDGLFHMFRNGFIGWPAKVSIGYLTSPDGINWTEVSEDPVFTSEEVPYAGLAALASSVLVEDDGTWVMYFYTWETPSGVRSPGSIGRATAPEPTGPWTPDAEPVLTPGPEGSWDDLQVSAPRVIKTDDGYFLYYAGRNAEEGIFNSKLGVATSPDGVTWTKYDDPATTDALFADSDPILESDTPNTFIHHADVLQTPDGWVMDYRLGGRSIGTFALRLATSDDGIHWTSASDQPFWTSMSIPRSVGFWYTDLVYNDGTYYLYVEGGRGGGTDIYVATHDGPLTAMS